MELGCKKVKLIGLESTRGSRRCSISTGLGRSNGSGGCRRWTVGWRRSGEAIELGKGNAREMKCGNG
jgi:hypothetical protein